MGCCLVAWEISSLALGLEFSVNGFFSFFLKWCWLLLRFDVTLLWADGCEVPGRRELCNHLGLRLRRKLGNAKGSKRAFLEGSMVRCLFHLHMDQAQETSLPIPGRILYMYLYGRSYFMIFKTYLYVRVKH